MNLGEDLVWNASKLKITFVPEAPGGFIQILENMIQLSTVLYFAQLINQPTFNRKLYDVVCQS